MMLCAGGRLFRTPSVPKLSMLIDGPKNASCKVILAHGAGAGMKSDFMATMAKGIAAAEVQVVRFEFPYMAEWTRTGKKKPPNREPALREAWREVIESVKADKLVLGGKSMGGRIASLIADEVNAEGLICLGYPFHPTGKPDKLRTEHLQDIKTPTLILQGERDAFGNRQEVPGYKLGSNIELHWLPDGDHSFKPRKASAETQEENWQQAIQHAINFIGTLFD